MRVRVATVADADAVAVVQVRSWQAAYRGQIPDDYLDGMAVEPRQLWWAETLTAAGSSSASILVVEESGTIVGFVYTCADRDGTDSSTGEIVAIYLLPEVWDRGAGRMLMESATESLRIAGFTAAVLWVLETNDRARRFYSAAGWHADGAHRVEDRGSLSVTEVRYRKRL